MEIEASAGRRAAGGRLARLTAADGLMVIVGLVAAGLRLADLAGKPLSAVEATAALSSYNYWAAGGVVAPPASPAYFSFTNIVMGLGGGGDVAARLVPALFGVLTVLLPWLWLRESEASEAGDAEPGVRPLLWLVAGMFMAVSPLLAAVSRTAGGDAIALYALLLVGLSVAGGRGGRTRAIGLGVGLGLGLASSPLFYTGALALIPAVALGRGPRLTRREASEALALAAVVFTLVSSFALLYLPGIGAALRLFPTWLGQFGVGAASVNAAGAATTGDPLRAGAALLHYEPGLAIMATVALLILVIHRPRGSKSGRFPAGWLVGTLILMPLQAGVTINAVAATLPGYWLAGWLAAGSAGARDSYPAGGRSIFWSVVGGLIGLGALVLAAFGRFTRMGLLSGEHADLIIYSSLAFLLAVVAIVAVMAWESAAARRGALLGLAALILFWHGGTARQLTHQGANDPHEMWVNGATDAGATDDGAVLMIDLVREISWQTAGSGRDLTVVSLAASPALDWYLRDLVGYRSAAVMPLDSALGVVIAPEGQEPALPSDYFGADFVLTRESIPAERRPSLQEQLLWLFFRESSAPLDAQRVVLWIRSDLAK